MEVNRPVHNCGRGEIAQLPEVHQSGPFVRASSVLVGLTDSLVSFRRGFCRGRARRMVMAESNESEIPLVNHGASKLLESPNVKSRLSCLLARRIVLYYPVPK